MKQTNENTDSKVYKTISHSWFDMWKEKEIEVSYRFSKPTAPAIKRMQSTAVKDATKASYNLALDSVHPEDKERLLADLEEYPLVALTLGTALVSAEGISNLGNI